MKYSEIFKALEEGCTVYYSISPLAKKMFKFVIISDKITRVASWWSDTPENVKFNDYLWVDLGETYAIS